jgi:hypothetical protein
MKGGTTTATTEDYDLDMGGGGGGHSALFGLWSEQHTDEQKQVGTINRNQTQHQNVATSDASRDRRESFSFSTSINQLHTLLQSYHLGTNRVMFFMQPVPHMQDAVFSFVRGLRRIEGVQEFFLIVNRPTRVKGLCLEIALETAHLYARRAYMPRLIALSDLFTPVNLAKTEQALGIAVENNALFDYYREIRDAWNYCWPSERWAMSRTDWYPTDELMNLARQVLAKVPSIGIEDAALIFEEYEKSTGEFFVSGRRFCACWEPHTHEEDAADEPHAHEEDCEESSPASLSHCDPLPGAIVYSGTLGVAWSAPEGAQLYNAVNQSLNDALSSSLLSSDRLQYGQGELLSTDFMLEELTDLVREAGDALPRMSIGEFSAVRALDGRGLGEVPVDTPLREFARMSTNALSRRTALDAGAVRRLKKDVLLEALARVDARRLPEDRAGRLADEARHERNSRLAAHARGDARPSRARASKGKPQLKRPKTRVSTR